MGSIDDFVTVNITKATATVSRAGFKIPAILTYHTVFPEFARRYANLQAMLTDGFTTSSREYKMAQTAFAQSPRPAAIIVGRRANAPLRDVTLTPKATLLPLTAYTLTIGGEAFTFTTDADPTVAEITAGLAPLVNAGGVDVLATDNTTDLSVESADSPGGISTAGVPFTIVFDASLWDLDDTTTNPAGGGIEGDLANMILANDDWYGLSSDALGKLEITALSTAIEALPKIYGASTQDSDVLTAAATSITALTKAAALDRTFVAYHPRAGVDFFAGGWEALLLTYDPGAATWNAFTLKVVTTYSLTDAERTFLETNNGNHYQETGGVNVTARGSMASGEWIDVTVFLDWVTARIKEGAFGAFVINPKIPFTDNGIQAMGGTTEDVLIEGARRGGIDPDGETPSTVTLPRAADVSAADKSARTLTYTAAFTLAGAIHAATVNVTVTV